MKWGELTDEQAKTLRRWFACELEVSIRDSEYKVNNEYKFKRNHEIEFRFNAPVGSWLRCEFHYISYDIWSDDFKRIWDHLNVGK